MFSLVVRTAVLVSQQLRICRLFKIVIERWPFLFAPAIVSECLKY